MLQPPTTLRKDFVRELSPAMLAELEGIRTRYHLSAGEVLFSYGETASRLVEIAGGSVKLWLDRPQEETLILRLVRPGELLGLREVITGKPHSVNAAAVTAVDYFAIPRKSFLDLMHRHFEIGFNVTRLLSAELSSAHAILRSMVAESSPSSARDRRRADLR
jgi:CRP-like cAMP-binding protein